MKFTKGQKKCKKYFQIFVIIQKHDFWKYSVDSILQLNFGLERRIPRTGFCIFVEGKAWLSLPYLHCASTFSLQPPKGSLDSEHMFITHKVWTRRAFLPFATCTVLFRTEIQNVREKSETQWPFWNVNSCFFVLELRQGQKSFNTLSPFCSIRHEWIASLKVFALINLKHSKVSKRFKLILFHWKRDTIEINNKKYRLFGLPLNFRWAVSWLVRSRCCLADSAMTKKKRLLSFDIEGGRKSQSSNVNLISAHSLKDTNRFSVDKSLPVCRVSG